MKTEVNAINACKREVSIEVEPENLNDDYRSVCEKYRLKGRVPGFRPGKAPMSVILARYKEAIREDFLDLAVKKHLREALQVQDLTPLQLPQLDDLTYKEGGPLSFKAIFEVLPKLQISNYKGIEIDKIVPEVRDEEIETALHQIQEKVAEYVPVDDRPVQSGDHCIISYAGKFLDEDRPNLESKEAYCEVGGTNTLKEFTEHLQGANVGDHRTFLVSYPEDFPNREIAGKRVEYSVHVQSIKLKKIPELNDDFARNVGKHDTLEGLREELRKDFLGRMEAEARSGMQDKLLDLILEQNPFEVPEVLVERQAEGRMNDYVRALIMQGIHPQTLDVNWAELQHKQRALAERDVKISLLLGYIAEGEKVEVTDEDLEEEVLRLAQEAKQSLEAARSRLTKEGGADRIKTRIRNRKSLDLLLSLASVKNPAGIIVES